MEALVWGERFLTGLPLVDEQHQHLVELINAFGELQTSTAEVPPAKLEVLVEELVPYARTHFVDEEALMRGAAIDARFVTRHCAEHSGFLRDVSQMQHSRFFDQPQTARVLLSFLMNWLAFHILGTAMQLARQVQRLERGEAAETAYLAEAREGEGPAHLLLGAFDELLGVLSARNAALVEANRQLESRMAHEINSPLGAVSTNVNVLAEYALSLLQIADLARRFAPQLPAAARASLALAWSEGKLEPVHGELGPLVTDIREGLARVKTIVSDLKAFARVDTMQVSEVQLGSCVDAALKLVGEAQREGVTFTKDLQATPGLRCLSAQVKQAVLGLVLNAAQAVRERAGGRGRGSVSIRTGTEGGFAFVEVKDEGVGMTPEVLSRAFEPFFTTRAPGKGVGLGLSSAYHCALAHGGRLEAASEPNVGTTMRLLLSLFGPTEAGATLGLTNSYDARRTGSARTPGPGDMT